jgi:hypothetical protein
MTRNHFSLASWRNTTALVVRFLHTLLTTCLGAVRSAGLKITRHALCGEFTNCQPSQLLPEYVMRIQAIISATQCCRAPARPGEPSQGHVPGERPRHGQLARVPGPSARSVPRQLAGNDDHAKNDRASSLNDAQRGHGPGLSRQRSADGGPRVRVDGRRACCPPPWVGGHLALPHVLPAT